LGAELVRYRAMDEWTKYLKMALKAALEAGEMLRKGMDERKEISYKGEVDLVTNFDHAAQEMIVDRLSSAFPDHGFLAEEDLSRKPAGDFRWLVDPLDGTTNYAHRFPVFTVSIGLEFQDRLVMGVVYDPTRQEMFEAQENGGARLNGRRIRVSRVADLNRSLLATGFPYDVRESRVNNVVHFNNFVMRAQAVRRCGSAAMDLCYLACGRFDGFWELKLKPWDMAAGAVIVREAGGRLSDFDGGEFSHFGSETLASNGLIHEAMIRVLEIGKAAESSRAERGKK
jgi:myo-inositol-1(or 4)-monophosphatase